MEKIILKLPVIYQYIYENIYDSDTLNYNKHAEKTWKFIKKHDELNLISKFNEKPDFINFDLYSSNNSDEDNTTSDLNYYNNSINPYDIKNPYIDEDIYNKNDSFIVFSINELLELLKFNNEEIDLNNEEKEEISNFIISILMSVIHRREYSNEINEMIEDFIEKYENKETTKEEKEIFDYLFLFTEEKENPFDFIYDYTNDIS